MLLGLSVDDTRSIFFCFEESFSCCCCCWCRRFKGYRLRGCSQQAVRQASRRIGLGWAARKPVGKQASRQAGRRAKRAHRKFTCSPASVASAVAAAHDLFTAKQLRKNWNYHIVSDTCCPQRPTRIVNSLLNGRARTFFSERIIFYLARCCTGELAPQAPVVLLYVRLASARLGSARPAAQGFAK